ncbi:hypothetical protein SDC9_169798 [bioreactor metagenome]|uniref:Uncharacterized protein n=1 Tax=bioreactor metagenome TaxID=1076179 RepID=A0A645G6Y9_9ZZZZ
MVAPDHQLFKIPDAGAVGNTHDHTAKEEEHKHCHSHARNAIAAKHAKKLVDFLSGDKACAQINADKSHHDLTRGDFLHDRSP